MCTVSYIPLDTGIVLTSNRDENALRPAALAPQVELTDGLALTYPKDPISGGSWIAATCNGDVAVLLNGAFENHKKKSQYGTSRGAILLAIIQSCQPVQRFRDLDLSEVENFTLLLIANAKLFECRWDGQQKHLLIKDEKEPHIWSSVTLYNELAQANRSKWFMDWVKSEAPLNQMKIIDFHRYAGGNDRENGLVIARENGISTLSITSVELTQKHTHLRYYDLKNEKNYVQQFNRTSHNSN